MVPTVERRQYHPGQENVPLSEAIREAIRDHNDASMREDDVDLFHRIDPDALDSLFRDADDLGMIVQFHLTNVIVSVWSDGAIDIRVTDDLDSLRPD